MTHIAVSVEAKKAPVQNRPVLCSFFQFCPTSCGLFREKGATPPVMCLQFSPRHRQKVEVRTGKHGIQPVFVFLQAPISDFPISNLCHFFALSMPK